MATKDIYSLTRATLSPHRVPRVAEFVSMATIMDKGLSFDHQPLCITMGIPVWDTERFILCLVLIIRPVTFKSYADLYTAG